MYRSGLAQRIVIAFVLLTLVVAGSFAGGIILTIHAMEERLLSDDLGGDLDGLLHMDSMEEWRNKPQVNQLFFFSGGPGEFALPAELAGLTEGFHEVFLPYGSYHAMVRVLDGRHYVLLQDQSEFERREELIYVVVVVGFLLSLISAGLLGWLLARRVLAPVIQLARQVRHRDQLNTLAPPLAPHYAADEVGQLAQAFDETLSQLREALKRERLFTSDVSHELRTPLMVLAGSCELLLENPSLDARTLRPVHRIARATTDMRDLVETFLQLARAESGQISLAPRATLTQVADELVNHWRDLIERKGIILNYQNQNCSEKLYNAPFLRSVMGNLLRNAWHYSEGGCILVRLTATGFEVEDDGAGIPENLRETLFEPFVRGNPNRGEGLGLGLSLVKRICQHENWQIELHPVEPHGCRFQVQLS